jgi:hypothetical protein
VIYYGQKGHDPAAVDNSDIVAGGREVGVGAYIAYAGGHIRHKEFRFEPAPSQRTQEHQNEH